MACRTFELNWIILKGYFETWSSRLPQPAAAKRAAVGGKVIPGANFDKVCPLKVLVLWQTDSDCYFKCLTTLLRIPEELDLWFGVKSFLFNQKHLFYCLFSKPLDSVDKKSHFTSQDSELLVCCSLNELFCSCNEFGLV